MYTNSSPLEFNRNSAKSRIFLYYQKKFSIELQERGKEKFISLLLLLLLICFVFLNTKEAAFFFNGLAIKEGGGKGRAIKEKNT